MTELDEIDELLTMKKHAHMITAFILTSNFFGKSIFKKSE